MFLNEIGVQPDLILAENEDGVVGYIRDEDLSDNVNTPEDALVHEENKSEITIPMYKSDSVTIIGKFHIYK